MTTANHVLVSSTIALAINQPVLALPIAFASHFALDGLPHFGYEGANYGTTFKHKMMYLALALDILGIIIVVSTFNFSAGIILLCAAAAVLPDLEHPYRYFLYERKGKVPPDTRLTKFHHDLQRFERPWGIYVEVAFFLVVLLIASRFLIH